MDDLGISFHLQFHEEAPSEPAPQAPPTDDEANEEEEEELPEVTAEEVAGLSACPLCDMNLKVQQHGRIESHAMLQNKSVESKKVHVEFCRSAKDMGLLEPMQKPPPSRCALT